MRLLIGIVGEKGSGKETFASILKELLKDSVDHITFSDLLYETLDLWYIPTTRENLQDIAIIMRKQFGEDIVANAIKQRMLDSKTEIVLLDGIRWKSDLEMLRSLPNNILVYITADLKIRFERSKNRKEKMGEEFATLEQFIQEEKKLTETLIPKIGKKADFKVINNGSQDDLRVQVEIFKGKFLKTAEE